VVELASVKIFLLSHQGFTDGFLLVVIPHDAWQRLAVGRYLLSLFFFLFFFREEQFIFERPLYHITCLALLLFLPACWGKEVMYPLWTDPHCGCRGPQSDAVDHHPRDTEGLIPPRSCSPISASPASAEPQGSHTRTLRQDI